MATNAERPCLLLVPDFTELEWPISDRLAEWAEVATYDPPGVGAEPIAAEEVEAVGAGELAVRDLIVRRGLEEVDRRGWKRFFLVSDAGSNATAARIATQRPQAVRGVALGHACLSLDMEGERAPMSREIWAAMGQLLRQDHREFIRHGIVQLTRGSVSDEIAGRMIERFPDSAYVTAAWESMASRHEPIGEMLARVGCPLLLAKHEGCISFTEEGFDDAVAAFPDARVIRVPGAPSTHAEFVDALREFCEQVAAAERERGLV